MESSPALTPQVLTKASLETLSKEDLVTLILANKQKLLAADA